MFYHCHVHNEHLFPHWKRFKSQKVIYYDEIAIIVKAKQYMEIRASVTFDFSIYQDRNICVTHLLFIIFTFLNMKQEI